MRVPADKVIHNFVPGKNSVYNYEYGAIGKKINQRSYVETLVDLGVDDNGEDIMSDDDSDVINTRMHSSSLCGDKLHGRNRKIPQKILEAFEKTFPETMKASRNMPLLREESWPKWLCLPFVFWQERAQAEYDKNIYPKLFKENREEFAKTLIDLKENPQDYVDYDHEPGGDFDPKRKPHIVEDITEDAYRLMFLGTWRYGKGVYRFNRFIYKALTKDTQVNGIIPSSVLFNLPEYCLYIETKNLEYFGDQILGFWVMLNWRGSKEELIQAEGEERCELMIMLNNKDNPWATPQDYMPIIIKDDTLENCIKESISYAKRMHEEIDEDSYHERIYDEVRISNDLELFKHIMPLILYLCSEEPEIDLDRKPGIQPMKPPVTKTNKHGDLIFPVEKPKIWEVGEKLGDKIRDGIERKEGGLRDGVVPHIRRAHWHGYWRGPRKGEREFIYKWLAPIFVGEGEEYLK